jgi:hypothetical protein
MKYLIFAAIIVVGLALAFGGSGSSDARDDSRLEQGVHRIDSYLAQGLTPEAHDALHKRAKDTSDFLGSLRQQAEDAAK